MSSHRNAFSVHSSIYRDSLSVGIFIQSTRDCIVIIQERINREIHLKNVSPSLASLHRCSLCEVTWHAVTQPTFWFGATWIRMIWYSLIIYMIYRVIQYDEPTQEQQKTTTTTTTTTNLKKTDTAWFTTSWFHRMKVAFFLFSYTIKCCSIMNLLCSS